MKNKNKNKHPKWLLIWARKQLKKEAEQREQDYLERLKLERKLGLINF